MQNYYPTDRNNPNMMQNYQQNSAIQEFERDRQRDPRRKRRDHDDRYKGSRSYDDSYSDKFQDGSRRSREHRSRHKDRSRYHDSRSRSKERRRRYESRSPSPPPRERKKRKSLFDVTPQEMANMGVFTPGPMGVPFMPGIMSKVGVDTRQAKRLYVGNIPRTLVEKDLIAFMNAMVRKHGIAKEDTVVECQINHEKNFAFIEFRTPEEATTAMKLDGIALADNKLKIRRPNNYVPGSENEPQNLYSAVLSQEKLFIANLPTEMPEEEIRKMLETFGTLKMLNLIKDTTTGKSKGYAFAEYEDQKNADVAIENLSGTEVGGKKLVLQRANLNSKTPIPITMIMGMDPVSQMLNMNVRLETALAGVTAGQSTLVGPSKILVLLNCLYDDELDMNDEDYQDLLEDIQNEMSKYGNIINIIIPRLKKGASKEENRGVGKIFIEYETKEDSQKAQTQVAGRKFQGRIIITQFYPETLFYQKKY